MSCKGLWSPVPRRDSSCNSSGVIHAAFSAQGELGDVKQEMPFLHPAEHWATPQRLPAGSPDAHLPPAAADHHPLCCAMLDAPALLSGTVCPSLRATQIGPTLAPTDRKLPLPAASLDSDKKGNTLGVLHPFSQLLLQPPLLLKAAISSLQQFRDIGNLSGVITSSLP